MLKNPSIPNTEGLNSPTASDYLELIEFDTNLLLSIIRRIERGDIEPSDCRKVQLASSFLRAALRELERGTVPSTTSPQILFW